MKREVPSGRFAALLCGLLFAWGVNAADLDEALRMLQAGQAEQAYQMLAPALAERAGDPEYDYLLGLAALDSGRNTEAVFAFERVLAVDPAHTRARAEIARAYYRLGELETARAEFENVRRQGVPPQVAEALQRYLNAIDLRSTGDRRQLRAYVEAGLAYDSNINSGASDRAVAVPAFGGALLRLEADGVEEEDGLAAFAAGFSGAYPLADDVDFIGGANFGRRQPFSDTQFGTMSFDAHAGLGISRGRDIFTAALQAETFLVDDDGYRDAYGFVGGWNREFGPRTRFSAFAHALRLNYPDEHIRDANRYVGGVGLSHAFVHMRTPIVYAGAYGGTEDERHSNVPHLGHYLYGFRLGGDFSLAGQARGFAAISTEFRDYDGAEPFFFKTRDDTRFEIKGGVNWRATREWSLTPQLSYVNNDSNVTIFDYDRIIFAVIVRREFD